MWSIGLSWLVQFSRGWGWAEPADGHKHREGEQSYEHHTQQGNEQGVLAVVAVCVEVLEQDAGERPEQDKPIGPVLQPPADTGPHEQGHEWRPW